MSLSRTLGEIPFIPFAKLLTLPSSCFHKHSSPQVVAENASLRHEKF